MVKNGTLWNLENAAQADKDIQFWRAEYRKRQFLLDLPCYEKIRGLYDAICEKWIAHMKKGKSEYVDVNKSTFFKYLQLSYIKKNLKTMTLNIVSQISFCKTTMKIRFADFLIHR